MSLWPILYSLALNSLERTKALNNRMKQFTVVSIDGTGTRQVNTVPVMWHEDADIACKMVRGKNPSTICLSVVPADNGGMSNVRVSGKE